MREVTHRLTTGLHLPSTPHIVDPEFSRSRKNYLTQAGLATGAMLAVLLLVDSLSDAALAAGLASSVVILFMHPSSRAATSRALIGDHLLALLVGSALSLLLFSTNIEVLLGGAAALRIVALASSLGILILAMAVTDTEHPPAAGTVLGIATKAWDPVTVAIIVSAVALLACIRIVLHRYLRDLL